MVEKVIYTGSQTSDALSPEKQAPKVAFIKRRREDTALIIIFLSRMLAVDAMALIWKTPRLLNQEEITNGTKFTDMGALTGNSEHNV